MPHSGCSALHGVNPNFKKITNFIRSCRRYDEVFRISFFQIIYRSFLSRRDFLLKVCTYWCKENIEISCYFNWVTDSISSAIMADTLPPFLEDIISCIPCHIVLESFYSAQNNVDSCFVHFALLVQLFYSSIFCVTHAWLVSVAYFLLLSSVYKVYLFSSLKF